MRDLDIRQARFTSDVASKTGYRVILRYSTVNALNQPAKTNSGFGFFCNICQALPPRALLPLHAPVVIQHVAVPAQRSARELLERTIWVVDDWLVGCGCGLG